MPKNLNNKDFTTIRPVLLRAGNLGELLDSRSMIAFSHTCRAARDVSDEARKKHALKNLLRAVVEGDEDLARKIITSRPELLLDSSAIVTDLSGKKIKGLTSIQAAICAGDIDMVQMMIDVLQQKLQDEIHLSFDTKYEIQRQLEAIYPNGDIDAVETEQKIRAREFKNSMCMDIFNAINIVATPKQVKFELETPGQHNADSPLNTALHNFRVQFAATSNQEKIFNPFYLLMAFELYHEQYDNFKSYNRYDLFFQQVIGYIQRHLPACYWQAFAQSLFDVVANDEELRRDFELRYDKGFYMRAQAGDLDNLGYKYGVDAGQSASWGRGKAIEMFALFQELLRTKKSGWENLFTNGIVKPSYSRVLCKMIELGLFPPRNAEPAPQPLLKSSCVIS